MRVDLVRQRRHEFGDLGENQAGHHLLIRYRGIETLCALIRFKFSAGAIQCSELGGLVLRKGDRLGAISKQPGLALHPGQLCFLVALQMVDHRLDRRAGQVEVGITLAVDATGVREVGDLGALIDETWLADAPQRRAVAKRQFVLRLRSFERGLQVDQALFVRLVSHRSIVCRPDSRAPQQRV